MTRTGNTVDIVFTSSAYDTNTISIISTVQSSSLARTKTLNSNYLIPLTLTLNGSNELELGLSDVVSATVLDGALSDVTSKFILDDGQRDNIYDYAKLTLKNGESAPTGPFTVTVDYYTHSGSGPLTINSYSVDYSIIPTYTSPTKTLNESSAFPIR